MSAIQGAVIRCVDAEHTVEWDEQSNLSVGDPLSHSISCTLLGAGEKG